MPSIVERERAYRRRVVASLVLTCSLQLLAWWLLPSPLGSPPLLPAARGETRGLSLCDVAVAGHEPTAATAPPAEPAGAATVAAPTAARPQVDPVPEPEIASEPVAAASRTPPAAASAADVATETPNAAARAEASTAGAGAADGVPGDGGGEGAPPADRLLHRRVWVHPGMPERILVKRKIDDFLLLQVLVGADGRVHDVRVLRDIPDCPECRQSAVEAARQDIYEPPSVPEESVGVWSQTFEVKFSYRR